MALNESNANRRTALLAAAQSLTGVEFTALDITVRAGTFLDWLEQRGSWAPEPAAPGETCGIKLDRSSSGCFHPKHHRGLHEDAEGRSWRGQPGE